MTPAPDFGSDSPPGSSLTVAIIGAGRLGRSLARRAARAGFRVLLEDVLPSNLRRAREALRRELAREKKAEGASDPACSAGRSLTAGSRTQDASRASAPEEFNPDEPIRVETNPVETFPVAFVASIEDAVRPAELVIDCVPDELESKLEILWLLDRMAPPHAVFATPTKTLSIADLAACTYRPDRCVALALSPSDLELADLEKSCGAAMEIGVTPATSRGTLALLERFWRALGFEPVFRPQA